MELYVGKASSGRFVCLFVSLCLFFLRSSFYLQLVPPLPIRPFFPPPTVRSSVRTIIPRKNTKHIVLYPQGVKKAEKFVSTQTELSRDSMLSSKNRSVVRARKALGQALMAQVEVSDGARKRYVPCSLGCGLAGRAG